MKKTLIAFISIAALTACLLGCKSVKGRQEKPSMSKCREGLSEIPEMAALLKSRGKSENPTQERLLEGMELALTVNGMVRSQTDPDADPDDWCYIENTRENFDKLIGALRQNVMPPTVDFVDGDSLDLGLQEEWLRSGNLIGNMTYAQRKAKKKTAQEFIDGVARVEQALAGLWKRYPPKRKYFRYPGLKPSSDQQKAAQVAAYLKQKGYVVASATIDGRDELFNQNYCAALAAGDQVCANYLKANFKSLFLDRTLKARAAARDLAGREVKHVLIVQANHLTCNMLGEILAWYKALGARFITLDEALRDPFYAMVDERGKAASTVVMRRVIKAQMGAAE